MMKADDDDDNTPPPMAPDVEIPLGDGNQDKERDTNAPSPEMAKNPEASHPTPKKDNVRMMKSVGVLSTVAVALVAVIAIICLAISGEHSDDEDFFPYKWYLGGGVIFDQDKHPVPAINLDVCMKYCEERDARGGNFFPATSLKRNCYCSFGQACIMEIDPEKTDVAVLEGFAFSKIPKENRPICDHKYGTR